MEPVAELADEYSSLFEEQLSAFEKEKANMKTSFAEKMNKITTELRSTKEENVTMQAEIESFKKMVSETGYITHFCYVKQKKILCFETKLLR